MCPPPRDLPNPRIKPRSSALQTDSLPSELPGKPSGEYKKGLSLSIGDMINEMSLIQSRCLVTQSWPALCDPMDCSLPGSSVHGDSPGKNTGTGLHALLQGIFPTQGSNPGVPHCRWILYRLSHHGITLTHHWNDGVHWGLRQELCHPLPGRCFPKYCDLAA